jgi:hypothetical protein
MANPGAHEEAEAGDIGLDTPGTARLRRLAQCAPWVCAERLDLDNLQSCELLREAVVERWPEPAVLGGHRRDPLCSNRWTAHARPSRPGGDIPAGRADVPTRSMPLVSGSSRGASPRLPSTPEVHAGLKYPNASTTRLALPAWL